MDTLAIKDRVRLDLATKPTAYSLGQFLFGHYDTRVYLTSTAYVDLGRGSFGCARHIKDVPSWYVGGLGSIGQFCETSDCSIMSDGNHRNDQPVNTTFGNIPIASHIIATNKIEHLQSLPPRPIQIGNGVVISRDAKIMPGVAVGDGAVIGANALVTRPAAAFGIHVGAPADCVRMRPNADAIADAKWWDWDLMYLIANFPELQKLAVESREHEKRRLRPRFVVRQSNDSNPPGYQILGFLEGETLRALDHAPDTVRNYALQLNRPPPYEWVADVWSGI